MLALWEAVRRRYTVGAPRRERRPALHRRLGTAPLTTERTSGCVFKSRVSGSRRLGPIPAPFTVHGRAPDPLDDLRVHGPLTAAALANFPVIPPALGRACLRGEIKSGRSRSQRA